MQERAPAAPGDGGMTPPARLPQAPNRRRRRGNGRTATAQPPAWADHMVGEDPTAREMRGIGLPQAMAQPLSARILVMWRWAPSPMRVSCSTKMSPGRWVTTSSWDSIEVMLADTICRQLVEDTGWRVHCEKEESPGGGAEREGVREVGGGPGLRATSPQEVTSSP